MPHVVEVTVKSQKGRCAFGHKSGDKIVFDGRLVKGDIGYTVFMVLLPKVYICAMEQSFHGRKMETSHSTLVRMLIILSCSKFDILGNSCYTREDHGMKSLVR